MPVPTEEAAQEIQAARGVLARHIHPTFARHQLPSPRTRPLQLTGDLPCP